MKRINFSIAAKVIVAFASVLVVIVALGLTAINRLGAVNDHAADIRDDWLPSLALQAHMIQNITQIRADETKLLVKSSATNVPETVAAIQKARDDINRDAKTYASMIDKGSKDEKLMKQFSDGWTAFQQTSARVMELAQKGDIDGATMLLLGDDRVAYRAARDALKADADANEAGGKQAANEGEAVFRATTKLVYGAIAVAAVLAALLGWSLIRGVSTPVRAMTGIMGRLANHDLAAEVSGRDRRDEIGAMARAVHVFKDSMIESTGCAASRKR